MRSLLRLTAYLQGRRRFAAQFSRLAGQLCASLLLSQTLDDQLHQVFDLRRAQGKLALPDRADFTVNLTNMYRHALPLRETLQPLHTQFHGLDREVILLCVQVWADPLARECVAKMPFQYHLLSTGISHAN